MGPNGNAREMVIYIHKCSEGKGELQVKELVEYSNSRENYQKAKIILMRQARKKRKKYIIEELTEYFNPRARVNREE